jgi:hypothetical protein
MYEKNPLTTKFIKPTFAKAAVGKKCAKDTKNNHKIDN